MVVRLPKTGSSASGTPSAGTRSRRPRRLDEPDPDWLARLRLDLSWPDEVPGRILAAGSSVEVLEPFEIRERVIATARRIVERYEPVETRGDVVPPPDGDTIPAPLLRPADASATGS